MKRTVLGAASVEAKKFGVKTGMQVWEAKKLCPQIILVPGDSDKYLETTKRFLNILKDYSPYLEVFSIDECFLQVKGYSGQGAVTENCHLKPVSCNLDPWSDLTEMAKDIKRRIKQEIGEWITCSIGISYNKLMAKLAGSLQKPDGLVVIPNQEEAIKVLDKIELDEICGIGPRIKKRLNNMGVFDFQQLRAVPLPSLLASFKSYGQVLYNMARGIDCSEVVPFYEKEEVKSIGHRHTIDHDTADLLEIKQILLKLTELVARRLRSKNLVGKTVHCWYRSAFQSSTPGVSSQFHTRCGVMFQEKGMQVTVLYTSDGLEIFKAAWKVFHQIWNHEKIRMIGVSISNLKSKTPQNLNFLPEVKRNEVITSALDKINNKYGEFTLQRGILLISPKIRRKPPPATQDELARRCGQANPFLSDRRFRL